MARRLVSRRSGDEEEILSGWHRRRKGADRRRSDAEDEDDGEEKGFEDVDEKVRACPVALFGDIFGESWCWGWRCLGPMAIVPCDARGCRPKAQDAPVHARATGGERNRLAAIAPARRGLWKLIEHPKRFMFHASFNEMGNGRSKAFQTRGFLSFSSAKDLCKKERGPSKIR